MSLIYVIKNKINSKVYIGKTNHSLTKRFNEHCLDSKRDRCKNRPIYRAMNKYGLENFYIELLEEVDNSISSDREIYWIKEYSSYGNTGYNATKGGDSRSYLDYDYIKNVFISEGKMLVNLTSKICNCDPHSVRAILDTYGISHIKRKNVQMSRRKLDNISILYIRENPDKLSMRDLANKFNVKHKCIFNIINRNTYKDI